MDIMLLFKELSSVPITRDVETRRLYARKTHNHDFYPSGSSLTHLH